MPPFDEYQQKIIKDPAKLSFDYVPQTLVHRDKEMQRLFSIFRQVVEGGLGQRAFLTGNVGTGKSVLSKRFCLDFQEWGNEKGKGMDFVVVNCRARNTPASVLLKIIDHFDKGFPDRGFSTTEMLEIMRKHINRKKIHLIVVLDEINVLIKKSGTDLLYALTRFDEESLGGEHRLSLILISQRPVYEFLDPATLSTFKRTNTVQFDNYNKEQLWDILRDRTELALYPGTIEDETLELIADIASEWGDARFGIELLENAGMIASEENLEMIAPDHVRSAKAMTHSVVTESNLQSLSDHMLLALLGVSMAIKSKAYITTSEAEKAYALASEEFGESPRAHTRYWEYLKELDGYGLLSLKLSGKGHVGKTTLISLPDIPSTALSEKVREMLGSRGLG
ncbi:MAG: AAA family ATPase [Thermoplasmata archaeon]|nr:AAA family ATPase [Thermoplasmata archaeon]